MIGNRDGGFGGTPVGEGGVRAAHCLLGGDEDDDQVQVEVKEIIALWQLISDTELLHVLSFPKGMAE